MNFINKLPNVRKVLLEHKSLYYQTEENIYKDYQQIEKLENNFFGEFYLNNGNLIIQSFNGSFFYLEKKYNGYYNYLINNQLTYLNSDDNFIYVIQNGFDKKTCFTNNFYSIKNNFLIILENKIKLFKPYKFQSIWQYSINHFPNYLDALGRETTIDIKQVIGTYKNLLWVMLGGGHLIALNLKNGELVHHVKNIGKGHGDLHLDVECGVIKRLTGHSYAEFDMNTLILTTKTIDESYFFRDSSFYLGDDNLYFCGIKNFPKVSVPNSFGIFNTKTYKTTWLEEQKEDWGLFYNPPQTNNEQLVILDEKQNLLIFEK